MISYPEKILSQVQSVIGGDLRISKRGVPHLVINHYYSICYFGKSKFFRIFINYATPENKKLIDLKNLEQIKNFFNVEERNEH